MKKADWHNIRRGVRNNRLLVALVVAGVLLFAAIVAMFGALWLRQNAVASSVREDALWAVYQADREVSRLAADLDDLIDHRNGVTLPDVLLRFDILYSRHELMEDTDLPVMFRSDSKLNALTANLADRLHAMLPHFDSFAVLQRADAFDVELMYAAVLRLRPVTEALVVRTNNLRAEMIADERIGTTRIHFWLAAAMAAHSLAMAVVIVLIWRQVRQLEISRLRLQRLSEELGRSAAAAEAGNRAKTAFLATMSHEIRTPLNGIIGMAELMAGADLAEEQREQLTTIRTCSDALIDLISDVLDFSKLESGTIDLERRRFDLGELVDGVVDMVAPRAEAKGLQLLASYPPVSYETDSTRLRQVLINLVGNAVKFTDRGAVAIRIGEGRDRAGRALLRVSVEDTGIGISPENIGRLFTEFTQADASINRRFGGTGLGLAISKRIVEALGGRIEVESREGAGSIFRFEIPVTRIASEAPPFGAVDLRLHVADLLVSGVLEQDAANLGRPAAIGGGAVRLDLWDVATYEAAVTRGRNFDPAATVVFGPGARRLEQSPAVVIDGPMTTRRLARILAHRLRGTQPRELVATRGAGTSADERHLDGHLLIVEDNAVNRRVAAGIVERMGMTCEVAVDGAKAVERMARPGIDLVLMDMQMPVMDGLEATRRIRAAAGWGASVPIIGLTANAFASDRAACLAAGMNDFVVKPVTREKLHAALEVFLAARDEAPAATVVQDEPTRAVATVAAAVPSRPDVAPAAEPPLLDPRRRTLLVDELGPEVVTELTRLFWTEAAELTAALERDYAAGDRDGVRRSLHTLTGSAANLGLARVVAAVAAVRSAGLLDCPEAIGRLAAALLATRAALVEPLDPAHEEDRGEASEAAPVVETGAS